MISCEVGELEVWHWGLGGILVAAMILGHLDGSMDFSQGDGPYLYEVDS